MALAVGFLSGGIEWDSPVMKSRHANVSEAEAQRHAVMRVASSSSPAVIRFDASRLNDEGLSGAAKGLRALSYEFCIPAKLTSRKSNPSILRLRYSAAHQAGSVAERPSIWQSVTLTSLTSAKS